MEQGNDRYRSIWIWTLYNMTKTVICFVYRWILNSLGIETKTILINFKLVSNSVGKHHFFFQPQNSLPCFNVCRSLWSVWCYTKKPLFFLGFVLVVPWVWFCSWRLSKRIVLWTFDLQIIFWEFKRLWCESICPWRFNQV